MWRDKGDIMLMGYKYWIVLAVVSSLALFSSPGAEIPQAIAGQAQEGQGAAVAVVDGKEITEQELVERIRGELFKLETQLYETRRNGVDELISEYLVEQAAKARGLSSDQLLGQEVDAKVGEVTPKEVEEFYQTNQARIRKPLDDVRPQVQHYLQQTKLNEARRAYVQELRNKAHVKVFLTPPIVQVSAEGGPFKGPKDAPVTIVEFSDFQCSYCQRVLPVLDQVMERYPGKVKLVFRDFPILTIHPHAQKAAEAAHCAGAQGKFWEYHDLLFQKQETIPTMNYAEHAQALGLEATGFQACLDGNRFRDTVERNYADGVKAGVSGTPAFFINGRLLSGAQPLEAFKAVIDDELERLGQQAQR
jgi:protein-disulfide isomerase